MTTTYAIPFAFIDEGAGPNLNRQAEDPMAAYFDCIVTAFSSIRRVDREAHLVFVSNVSPRIDLLESLDLLDVDVRTVAFDHRPPENFFGRFNSSLYLIDALAALDASTLVLIDPDVVVVRPLDTLVDFVGNRVGALTIPYPPMAKVNGLSRMEAGMIHADMGLPHLFPKHVGGEFYIIPRSVRKPLLEQIEAAWQRALKDHSANRTKFTTEEHILSYALRSVPNVEINSYVERIWTAYSFRRVPATPGCLVAWHLPAEKGRGFSIASQAARNSASWFWTDNDRAFVDRMAKVMGISEQGLVRRTKNLAAHGLRHAREIFTDAAHRVYG